ncbi:MAG: restriction endonuclease [Acidobacteriota bacterium]|nr:restriction endonuclease [Acidobacteriota bacterium]
MAVQTLDKFFEAVQQFAKDFSNRPHNDLRGITDGKAVGTYIERAFQNLLIDNGVIEPQEIGNSAKGIDLPNLNTDIKVTSIKQPQSSSPFKSFKQKIEGLGYSLILFVYDKTDSKKECRLPLLAVRFIPAHRTADFQTTKGIHGIIEREGNAEDIFAFLVDRMIPVDEIALMEYAEWLISHPPILGYLTISNALQWRLQYKRVITSELADVINLDPIAHGDLAELIPKQTMVTPIDDEQ